MKALNKSYAKLLSFEKSSGAQSTESLNKDTDSRLLGNVRAK